MFDFPYIVAILTPLVESPNPLDRNMALFAEKYRRSHEHGFGVSIPDNPMGRVRHSALEAIAYNRLPVDGERIVMNLNTFHTKADLDNILDRAKKMGIAYILVVRGDGGPLLPALVPADIGSNRKAATSSDLIRYIHSRHPDVFIVGAAFNPYNPADFELKKVQDKIEAGAQYIVTQPVIGKDPNVDSLFQFNIPVVVEAWMSDNVELLYKSVRKKRDERAAEYDPGDNLQALHAAYPDSCMYLSLLSFKENWRELLPKFKAARRL